MCLCQHEGVEVVSVLHDDLLVEFLQLFLSAEAPNIREEDAKSGRRLGIFYTLLRLLLNMSLTFGGSLGISVELAGRQHGLLSEAWSL